MAALLQQLQHVLGTWDATDDEPQERTVLSSNTSDGEGERSQKSLFVTSVEKINNVGSKSTNGVCIAAHAKDHPTLGDDEFVSGEGKTKGTSNTRLPVFQQRQMLTRLELSRAALALFTSNAGIYRPILNKTLGFVFEFIDELLNDNMDILQKRNRSEASSVNDSWETRANDEVGMAYERMRVMEARMAKLVEEAALQRDHLRAEIVERDEREKKLNELLKHQMQLTHLTLEGGAEASSEDHLYVKRLIARAEKEHSLDEFMKQIDKLLAEREDLNRRLQTLLDLNGRYALQSMELAARLSIITDHNISLSIEVQTAHNEANELQRRCEKYLQELAVVRNTVMAAFVKHQQTGGYWWTSIHKQRHEKAFAESAGLRTAASGAAMFRHFQERKQKYQQQQLQESLSSSLKPEQPEPQGEAATDVTQGVSVEMQNSTSVAPEEWQHHQTDHEDAVCRLWITPYGKGTNTPAHLRAASSVEFLRVSPVVAEHFLRALLSAWYEDILGTIEREEPRRPLDVFAQQYLYRVSAGGKQTGNDSKDDKDAAEKEEEGKTRNQHSASDHPTPPLQKKKKPKRMFLLKGAVEKEAPYLNATRSGEHTNGLRVAYALDAVARSNACGSLTYAFGLVGRKLVSEDLFLMLEFDRTILIALCRYLDAERCAPAPESGVLPTVYFLTILSTMYPSYSLDRLHQLLNAAYNDGGSIAESCMLLRYGVLFPPRMLLCSASATVEGSGALWDTGFAHLLSSHICDDVAESWRSVDDSLDALAQRAGAAASEQQLGAEGLSGLADADHAAWSPAIRAALASWGRLRVEVDRAVVALGEVPRVPIGTARRFLREQLLIRRGTRPQSSSAQHHRTIEELERKWGEFGANVPRLDPTHCAELVKRVDPLRHLAWGPAELCVDKGAKVIRHVNLKSDLGVDTLLNLLKKETTDSLQ